MTLNLTVVNVLSYLHSSFSSFFFLMEALLKIFKFRIFTNRQNEKESYNISSCGSVTQLVQILLYGQSSVPGPSTLPLFGYLKQILGLESSH